MAVFCMVRGQKPMRKLCTTLGALLWLIALISVASATEIFVVGGESRGLGWEEAAGSAPVIDFTARPGWILPGNVAPNTNIALETYGRGGRVTSPNAHTVLRLNREDLGELLQNIVDGDNQTAFEVKNVAAIGILLVIDLGARFGVNHIRFFPRPSFRDDFLKGYALSINDGVFGADLIASSFAKLPDQSLFSQIAQDGGNKRDTVNVRFPLQYVRYIRLESTQRFNWEIDELEIFGRGFVPEASYVSEIFDFDQPAIWGRLSWAAEHQGQPESSRLAISTRSGNSRSPVDAPEDWSPWSSPYKSSNTRVRSPAPRRYFQFKVDFASDGLEDGVGLDSLAFEVSRPALADSVIGEIWPQDVSVGDTTFTYAVRVVNARGFDRLEIDTSAPVEAVRSVRLDDRELDFVATTGARGLVLEFAGQSGTHRLEVVFDTAVLRYETVFAGRLIDRRVEALPQEIVEGDAAAELPGDDLSVRMPLTRRLINRIEAAPNPFTPNGDGVNDRTVIAYDLLHLTRTAPVFLAVYDLAGNRLAQLTRQQATSGRFWYSWDGRDADGRLLPPGFYAIQVEVETDVGTERRSSAITIAY